MQLVRKLTEDGIDRFSEYLRRLNAGERLDPPTHLLHEEDTSEALAGTAGIEPREFRSKGEAAVYLETCLGSLERHEVDNDVGLWTWLSLYFFDQVCPIDGNGKRKPGEMVRHVLSKSAQKYYRHLLAGPYRLRLLHGDCSRIFLHGELPVHGDFSEQLASRLQFISNRSLIQVIDRLYYEVSPEGEGRPKRGALTRTRPGNVRRFISVLQQFELTYDMYAMSADQIQQLLPKEFTKWATSPVEAT